VRWSPIGRVRRSGRADRNGRRSASCLLHMAVLDWASEVLLRFAGGCLPRRRRIQARSLMMVRGGGAEDVLHAASGFLPSWRRSRRRHMSLLRNCRRIRGPIGSVLGDSAHYSARRRRQIRARRNCWSFTCNRPVLQTAGAAYRGLVSLGRGGSSHCYPVHRNIVLQAAVAIGGEGLIAAALRRYGPGGEAAAAHVLRPLSAN